MKSFTSLLLILLLCTCGPAQKKDTEMKDDSTMETDDSGHDDDHHEDGVIHLTKEQMATMDIQFGAFSNLKINDYLSATGTLGLPPNAYVTVSARAKGFIRNSRNYVEGDYVKKGARLAYLENAEFIDEQQAYLEISAELTFLRQELERQETLLKADAGILKNVQQLRAQLNGKMATLKGRGQKLAYLGINTAELTPDNIVERITLSAPRSGYISKISVHDGMYVDPSTELMEIIDEAHLHLELDVFERDIARLEEDQRVTYHIPALGTQEYEAEIHVIGKEFNTQNKTVRVHAHLKGKQPHFIRELFAEAKIWLNDQTVSALPEAAIVTEGKMAYVFAALPAPSSTEIEFEKLMVHPGATENGLTAVRMIDPLPQGMEIVTKGAYFVQAQGMVGEMEHSH
ncbi:MAG: efflux RND transporter periplasmic adaptor subunit [Lewinella sp.]